MTPLLPTTWRRAPRAASVCLALATAMFLVVGCRRKHVDGTIAADSVLNEWTARGFGTEAVKATEPDPWDAGACSHGLVAGLDVLLCEYGADETLAIGEKKVLTDWEQASVGTGVVIRSARTLLAISDTAKVDPNGRTIMRLVDGFRAAR